MRAMTLRCVARAVTPLIMQAKAERKRLKKLAKAQAAAAPTNGADALAPPSVDKPKKRKSMAPADGDTAAATASEPRKKKSRKSDGAAA